MGQYYKIVNLDKMQYLHPHKFNEGLKLMEFSCSTPGTMTALALLLADGNGRGGGDMRSDSPLIGSWAGNRIVVAGDYADPGRYWYGDNQQQVPLETNLYSFAAENFEDISLKILPVMMEDDYVAEERKGHRGFGG